MFHQSLRRVNLRFFFLKVRKSLIFSKVILLSNTSINSHQYFIHHHFIILFSCLYISILIEFNRQYVAQVVKSFGLAITRLQIQILRKPLYQPVVISVFLRIYRYKNTCLCEKMKYNILQIF